MEFLAESLGLLDANNVVLVDDENEQEEVVVLAKSVEKRKLADGTIFSGRVDALTGELLWGHKFDPHTKESYEGSFRNGGKRHGPGATFECPSRKFLGSFADDMLQEGTLVVQNEFSFTGRFLHGQFHGEGTLVLENGTIYRGEFQHGQYYGEGELMNTSGETYKGIFRNGRKHGQGKMRYRNGGSYEGEWKQGAKHGHGLETTGNGVIVYEGEFDANKRHGHGLMTTPLIKITGKWHNGHPMDGPGWRLEYRSCCHRRHTISHHGDDADDDDDDRKVLYEGELQSCRPHGKGVLKVYDKAGTLLYSYKGEFCFGLRHGTGRTTFPEMEEATTWCGDSKQSDDQDSQLAACDPANQGSSNSCEEKLHQQGTFLDGILDGVGCLTLLDGSVYTGLLKKGIPHGRGTLKDTANAVTYKGDFDMGVKAGGGEEQYSDGTVFVGEFSCGMRHGEGVLRASEESGSEVLYEGEWMDDAITGTGMLRKEFKPTPGVYTGQVVDGQRHGHGIFTAESGYILEGEWSQDQPTDGDWVITCPTGTVYYGTATCNSITGIPEANGFGTQNEANGDFYSGTFRDGKRHGSGLCVFTTGEQWDGKWEEGVFVKYGRARP